MVHPCLPNSPGIAFLSGSKQKPLRKVEDPDIDRIAHRCETGAVRVQQIARTADGRVRLELGFEGSGRAIDRDGIEVEHAVEDPGSAYEFVQRPALGIDLQRSIRRVCAP